MNNLFISGAFLFTFLIFSIWSPENYHATTKHYNSSYYYSPFVIPSDLNLDTISDCHKRDSVALITLYQGSNHKDWAWDTMTLMKDWKGVTLDECGCVSELQSGKFVNHQFQGNTFDGKFSATIAKLRDLRKLIILYGTFDSISNDVDNLVKLEELSLAHITFSNTFNLTSAIGNLKELRIFQLNNLRQIVGNIPGDAIARLEKLEVLTLRAGFSGGIPVKITTLKNLREISIIGNTKLGGTIPKEFGSMKRLTYLNLQNNNLTGTIPPELGNLDSLEYLYLHKNPLLGGSIPDSLSKLKLSYFHIRATSIEGRIPTDFFDNKPNLRSFVADSTYLSGPIPKGIGSCAMIELRLSNTQISGLLPTTFPNILRTIRTLDLSNTQLEGCFPYGSDILCGVDSVTVNFSGNPGLPFEGDYEQACTEAASFCPQPHHPSQFILEFRDSLQLADMTKMLVDSGATLVRSYGCGHPDLPLLQLWEVDRELELDAGRDGMLSRLKADTVNAELNFYILTGLFNPGTVIRNYCVQPPQKVKKDITRTKVRVAVIDSGVNLKVDSLGLPGHPHLDSLTYYKENERFSPLGVDYDRNCWFNDRSGMDIYNNLPLVIDWDGHGTFLALILADNLPANVQLELVNLKVHENGKGGLFNLISAIYEAIALDVAVINLSLGYNAVEPSPALYRALKKAEERGIIVVVSAGNEARDNDRGLSGKNYNRWPGAFSSYNHGAFDSLTNIIVVGSTNLAGTGIADFSSWGKRLVHLLARGTESALLDGRLETFSGSSLSVPFVVRTIVKIKAHYPKASYSTIINCLQKTARPSESDRTRTVAWGILDENAALHCMGIDTSEQKPREDLPLKIEYGPNPFHGYIRFDLESAENEYFKDITFSVIDMLGREVYRQRCDFRQFIWAGRDANGNPVSPGTYLCQFTDKKGRTRQFKVLKI